METRTTALPQLDASAPDETAAAARPSLPLLVATGAAMVCAAGVIGIFVHEIVGHGGTALLQGYPVLAFFVSPIEGYAISHRRSTVGRHSTDGKPFLTAISAT